MRYFHLDAFWPRGLRASNNLVSIGRESYLNRVAQEKNGNTSDGEGGSSRNDLMSFLIKAKDPDTGLPLASEEVTAEAISFIVGGSDTTSSTMTNVVDFVSRDLQLQEKIYHELKDAFPGPLREDWIASFEVVNKLPLLNAVVREVMRVRPTSSTGLERVAPAGGATIAGVFLNEGTLVSVPTVAIHKNPRVFSDPDTFDPYRWLASDVSRLLDHFIPFSVGPRACIGRNFAWTEILKTLGTLFRVLQVRRVKREESVLREGFFVKGLECEVVLSLRD
jgi:benzoate 4-monooxygenase